MAEENTATEVENNDATDEAAAETTTEEVTYTPEEEQAMEHGWAPKDQWKGDESDWVSAKEFNRRGELFGKIRNLERDRDSLRQATSHMKEMLAKAKETEYNRAVRDLKAQKKAAAEEGETTKMLEIDEQIEELTNDHNTFQQTAQAVPEVNPQVEVQQYFTGWQQKNQWYTDDPDMRLFADSVGENYARQHPNATVEQMFAAVDKQVRKAYPEKFQNPRRSSPSKVESTTQSGSGGKAGYSEKDLSDEQRQIMNTMIRSGVMTKEEYIDELARIGELG